MKRVYRRRLKAVVQIELSSLFIDSVNKHGSNAYDIRSLFDPGQRVAQQRLPKPPSLLLSINGEARQKYHANGMIGETVRHSIGGFMFPDGTGRDRMIARDRATAMRNVGFGRFGLLVRPLRTASTSP